MSKKRTKTVTWLLVFLVALWVAAQAVVLSVRHVHDREARQKAQAWLQQAQEVAKPDFTPTDAIRWLQQNGAGRAYRGETEMINGKEVERHTIEGYLSVSAKTFWTSPLTARLVFRFDTDWHFTNIEVEELPYKFAPSG